MKNTWRFGYLHLCKCLIAWKGGNFLMRGHARFLSSLLWMTNWNQVCLHRFFLWKKRLERNDIWDRLWPWNVSSKVSSLSTILGMLVRSSQYKPWKNIYYFRWKDAKTSSKYLRFTMSSFTQSYLTFFILALNYCCYCTFFPKLFLLFM